MTCAWWGTLTRLSYSRGGTLQAVSTNTTSRFPDRESRSRSRELKSIVNPGGVGQPRDGDPRAAYMLLDPDNLTVTLKRQSYDVAKTQELIRLARLPSSMAERLAYGW